MTDPVTSVENSVKKDVASVQTTVQADLAKTYSAKIVLAALAVGVVIGAILKAIL